MKLAAIAVVLGLGACNVVVDDQFVRVVVSRASAKVDPAAPTAQAQLDVLVTVLGGERAHTARLDGARIAPSFELAPAEVTPIDLRFATPTLELEPEMMWIQSMVAGDVPNATFAGRCGQTMALTIDLAFDDTADLVAFGPPGALAITCP